LKILIIHTKYAQAGGEDAVVVQETALLKQSHDVEVVYFQNQTGIKGMFQFLGSIWNLSAGRKVRTKINQFQPDVVHLHNFHFASGPFIIRLIHKMGVPMVQTLHNYRLLCPSAILLDDNQLFLDSLQQKFAWSAVRKRVYRKSSLLTFWLAIVFWWHKKIGTFKMVDRYICLTEFSKQLIHQSQLGIEPHQIVVKPNFTKIREQTQELNRGNHFLFVGRLSEEKGIDVLLAAFENTAYNLKIAGDGPLVNKIKQTANQCANITYLGPLSNKDVNLELIKAQALIFPSIWYEGMPMTILEAFSNKTPVIASNLGAMSSMIQYRKNGLHFEAGNALDLKVKLSEWMNLSDSEKEQIRQETFKCYQTLYAPEQQLQYFDDIYQSVLKS
jgi:glycosyltransferase involved in cell wall biosynthesis